MEFLCSLEGVGTSQIVFVVSVGFLCSLEGVGTSQIVFV